MKKRLPILTEQFTNNWIYKSVALIVALAIWATTLHGRKDTLLVRNMDLEFILSPNLSITNIEDRTVRVKISGPRNTLKKFSQTSQAITINLAGTESGHRKIEIRPSDIPMPVGAKLISISPNTFDLDIKEVKKP